MDVVDQNSWVMLEDYQGEKEDRAGEDIQKTQSLRHGDWLKGSLIMHFYWESYITMAYKVGLQWCNWYIWITINHKHNKHTVKILFF